ncbi:unnamed protein product [Darwinula stevensoni]|uniref:PLAT domain-containing protein n=1 Tax=Darwinula stevensoni TaxID=69355 RepID=A0A7R9A8P9_9CRUS|nr:unnamed protein product [Darwinula stevensoni]CAG0896667.1 unnamed protein product [Darwinula stevensoni]
MNVTLAAFNEFQQWVYSTEQYEIRIVGKVQKMKIDDYGLITKPGSMKELAIGFESLGVDACLLLDFGDGFYPYTYGEEQTCQNVSMPTFYQPNTNLTNPLIVHHFYWDENVYRVTAQAWNQGSSTSTTLEIAIVNLDCMYPDVAIEAHEDTYIMSKPFTINGLARLNCSSTVSTRKAWNVTEVDKLTKAYKKTVNILDGLLRWDKPQISVPARFLPYGYYRFRYTVGMIGIPILEKIKIERTAETFVEVIPSPLLPMVLPGGISRILRSRTDSVELQPGLYSQDPDNPNNLTGMEYYYFCKREGEKYPQVGNEYDYQMNSIPTGKLLVDKGGCFGNGPGVLDVRGSSLKIPCSVFSSPGVYNMMVEVRKTGRKANAYVDVEISALNSIPNVLIACKTASLCQPPRPEGIYVNPTTRLAIKGSCNSGCEGNDSNLVYSWELRTVNCSYNPCLTSPQPMPVRFGSSRLTVGLQQMEIAISQEFFAYIENQGMNRFDIRLGITINSTGAKGYSEFYMIKNRPPTGGKCVPTPPTNSILKASIDAIYVSCTNWIDPEGELITSYAYYSMREDGGTETRIDLVKTVQEDRSLYLGVGIHNVHVIMQDSWGAVTDLHLGNFTMELPTPKEFEMAKRLGVLIGSGDPSTLAMISQAQASVYQNAPWMKLDTNSLQNLPPTEVESRLAAVQQGYTDTLSGMALIGNTENQGQILVTTSVLAQVASGIDGGSVSTVAVGLQGRQAVTTIFENMFKSLDAIEFGSPEEVLPILKNALVAGTKFMEGVEGQLKKGGNCDEVAQVNKSFCSPADKNQASLDYEFPPKSPLWVQTNDEDTQRCCYILDRAKYESKGLSQIVVHIISKLVSKMMQVMVQGDIVNVATESGVNVTVMKDAPVNLLNQPKFFGSGSSFEFKGCPVADCNKPIGFSFSEFPHNIINGPNSDSKAVNGTKLISISLMDENGTEIKVENLNPPLRLQIPIVPQPNVPNSTWVNPKVRLLDRRTPIIYHILPKPDIPGRLQLEFSFDPASEPKNFLILFRDDGLPLPIQGKFDQDDSCETTFEIRTMKSLPALTQREWLMSVQPGAFRGRDTQGSAVGTDVEPTSHTWNYRHTCRECPHSSYVGPARCAAWDRKPGKYRLLSCSKQADSGVHNVTVGVMMLKEGVTFQEMLKTATVDNMARDYLENRTQFTSYCLQSITTRVVYFNDTLGKFTDDGLSLLEADGTVLKMESSHMTTFGGGFFVMPNTVDLEYVFHHLGFDDNLTIYMTIIFTGIIILVLLVWARLQDKKDLQMIGAIPLPDNDPRDAYVYEILVSTGDKNLAATDSIVSFILSGEKEETPVRVFGKPTRRIFGKGSTDAFVMTTPRPLGNLNYLRIWHDNSGKGTNQSWFLNFLIVKDIQTGIEYEFIANAWFAVEKGDGQIDRLLPVAYDEQKRSTDYLLSTHSQRNFRDGHLWFSVFLRPPRSRFTRVQRVGCCAAFLYLSMLVNAMWYGTVPDASPHGLQLGPFVLTPEQMGVGVMGNLIVFPPSFLIIMLFRKSRPRVLRPSRIDKALDEQSAGRVNYIPPGSGTKAKYPRKKRCTLPWWFMLVAWFLILVCIGVSVFFTWAYGIQFGNSKTLKWVTSLVISFFSSVLLVQPLKVFLMALFLAAVCKVKPDEDDADEDEEDPRLRYDEQWIQHDDREQEAGIKRIYQPLSKAALEAAREKRLKEIKMWELVKEIGFYVFYLWVLLVLSYGNRDPNAYYLKRCFVSSFLRLGDDNVDFSKVLTASDFWNWMNQVALHEIRAENWYNGSAPYGLRGFLNDRANRLLGYPILRQIRVLPDSCTVPWQMAKANVTHCAGSSGLFNEDSKDYCNEWRNIHDPGSNCSFKEFTYTSAENLNALPIMGYLDTYSGGGYVMELRGYLAEINDTLNDLQNLQWIDKNTRAVLLEFYTYNAQVNLFGSGRLMVEMVPGGGFVPSWRFDGIRLIIYREGFGLFVFICEILYLLFVLIFTYRCAKSICENRKAYFGSYWSYAEVSTVLVAYAAVGLYLYRLFVTDDILKNVFSLYGNDYTRLQYASLIDELFLYAISFLSFVGMMMLLKLLRFNRRIGILSSTMKQCWQDLSGYAAIFLLLFVAFAIMFYLFFYRDLFEWRNFGIALITCFSMMLGRFKFDSMKDSNIFAAVFFFFFAITMSIVMINVLLTIIIRAFEVVKHDIVNQPNDYEILDFLYGRFRAYLGFPSRSGNAVAPSPKTKSETKETDGKEMEGFHRKVDQLVEYIDKVYFQGNINAEDKGWISKMQRSAGRNDPNLK